MDERALRSEFERELETAGLALAGRDRELFWAMWRDFYPQRAALRAWTPDAEEEPLT
jgi:hypothetical protein